MKGIRALLVLLVVGSVVTAVAWSAVTEKHAIEPIPAFTPTDLTAEPTDNWTTARGDIYNRQYSAAVDHQGQRQGPQGRVAHARRHPDEGQAELHRLLRRGGARRLQRHDVHAGL